MKYNLFPREKKLVISDQVFLKLYIAMLVMCIPAEPLLSYEARWLMIIAGAFLVLILSRSICITSYMLFQLCFTGMLFISLLYAPEGGDGMGMITQNTRAFIQSSVIIFLCLRLQETTEKRVRLILNSYLLGTVVILLYTLAVEGGYVFSSSGYWRLGSWVFRDHGTLMVLSYSIIIAAVWCLFCVFDDKRHRGLYVLSLALLLFCGALSGTKKVFVAIGVFLALYLLIRYRRNGAKLLLGGLLICALLIGIFYLLLNNEFLYLRIGYRIEQYLLSLTGTGTGGESTESRALMRAYGMQLFWDSPVYGNGVSSFRWYFLEYAGQYLYSHCNYVELLCNHGLIGFALYYGYYLWLLIASFKSYLKKKNTIFLFSAIYLIVLLILDYGQVSYYRPHYMLIAQVISVTLLKNNKYRIPKEGGDCG